MAESEFISVSKMKDNVNITFSGFECSIFTERTGLKQVKGGMGRVHFVATLSDASGAGNRKLWNNDNLPAAKY